MTKEELVEKVFNTLPHKSITNLDLSNDRAIRFDYEGDRYRVTTSLFVETVEGGCLRSGDKADAMEKLLKGR